VIVEILPQRSLRTQRKKSTLRYRAIIKYIKGCDLYLQHANKDRIRIITMIEYYALAKVIRRRDKKHLKSKLQIADRWSATILTRGKAQQRPG